MPPALGIMTCKTTRIGPTKVKAGITSWCTMAIVSMIVRRQPLSSHSRSYKVLHLSRKIILANLKIWCSKMQPLSENQRPYVLTSLMNMSFVMRLPREMHLSRSSSNAPRLPSFLDMLQNPHVLLTFGKVQNPLRLPRKTKCASRHNGVHFFDISTSKSGPRMMCFVHFDSENCFATQQRALFDIFTSKSGPNMRCIVHFDLETCFAPQRCALFRHRNFQKCSEHGVSCTFWLGYALRATTACKLLISHLARWLCTRRFSEPAFRPSGATNHWKNTMFHDFPTFSRTCIFFLLTLSLLWSSIFCSSPLWLFPPLLFHLSLLSEVWLLSFLRSTVYLWYIHRLPRKTKIYRWYTTPPSGISWYFLVQLLCRNAALFCLRRILWGLGFRV